MHEAGKEDGTEMGTPQRLKIYAILAAALVVVALLSFLIVPHGSGAKACMGYLLDNSKYECLTSLAISSLNASACGGLPAQGAYPADSCYAQVAQRSGNAGACGRMLNATAGYACTDAVAVATGNYALCGGIGEPYASQCTVAIAVRLDRPSLCSGAANATSAEECSSVIYVDRMLRLGTAGDCANVSGAAGGVVADYVISNVTYGIGSAYSNVTTTFMSLSFMQNLTYSARDFCYDLAAAKLHDPAICRSIGSAYVAGQCGAQFATAAANATFNYTGLGSICSQLGYGSQECQALRMAQAISTDNASECGSLTSLGDNCYSSLASAYNNTGYCRQISNASVRDACLNKT